MTKVPLKTRPTPTNQFELVLLTVLICCSRRHVIAVDVIDWPSGIWANAEGLCAQMGHDCTDISNNNNNFEYFDSKSYLELFLRSAPLCLLI